MAKKLLKSLLLPILVLATALAFIACDGQIPDVKYSVTYVIGADAQGTAPTEEDKAIGEKFIIKSADGITAPEGKEFAGWNDGSNTYAAGAEYIMPTKAVTFAAQWKDKSVEPQPPVKFKVTYDLNGGTGTAPTETDKEKGEKFDLKSDDGITAPDGKEFAGWSDGSNTYTAGAEYTMPEKAVTFTAQWGDKGSVDPQPTKYKVTYDLNGGTGTAPTETDKEKGEKFDLKSDDGITAPDGKEFAGWSDGQNKYAPGVEFTMPEKDVTFTAQWKGQIYTKAELDSKGYIYLYDDNTGKFDYLDASDKKQDVAFTYTLSGTAIAVKVGDNTFNGTYENNLLTVNITHVGTTFKFGEAQVEPLPTGKPTIEFNANGGTGSAPSVTVPDTVDNASGQYKIAVPSNTYTPPANKQFDGWCINGATDANGKEVTHRSSYYFAEPGSKVVFKALWKDAAPDVATGTSYYGECHLVKELSDEQQTIPDLNITVVEIKFDVEKVAMYYREKGAAANAYVKSLRVVAASDDDKPNDYGSGAKYYEASFGDNHGYYLLLDADKKIKLYDITNGSPIAGGEFFALGYEPGPGTEDYTVTFDPNNGGDTWQVKVSNGGVVQKPQTDPAVDTGKVFWYWKDDATGNQYTFGSAVTGDLALSAVYAWQVSFTAGDGSGKVDPIFVKAWTQAGVTLPKSDGMSNGSKVFVGWWDGTYSDSEQTVKNIYDPSDRYVKSDYSGNVTFEAQWQANLKYSVSFEKSSVFKEIAQVSGNPPVVEDQDAGSKFTVPDCTYTFTGHTFKEWQVRKYNSQQSYWQDTGVLLQANTEYTMPSYSIKLYAVWQQNAPTTVTVTYKTGDHGTGTDVVKSNVTPSDNYEVEAYPSTFAVENFYMCIGWKVEGDNSDSKPLIAGSKYNLQADTVFVAQYQNGYFNYDNDYTASISLDFSISMGEMEYGEDGNVMFDISISGNNITLTSEDDDESTGTFVNNVLNIAITVNNTTYTFGNPGAVAHTVTYLIGDGASGTAPTETDKEAGAKFNLKPTTGITPPTGKEFKGWSDGTNTYNVGDEFTMPDANVTFTALWGDVQGGDTPEFVNVNLSELNGKVFDAGKTIMSVTSYGSTTNYTAARLVYDSNLSSYKLMLIADTSKTSGRSYTQKSGDTATSGTDFIWVYSNKDSNPITFGFVKVGNKYKLIINSIKTNDVEKLDAPVELTEI